MNRAVSSAESACAKCRMLSGVAMASPLIANAVATTTDISPA